MRNGRAWGLIAKVLDELLYMRVAGQTTLPVARGEGPETQQRQ